MLAARRESVFPTRTRRRSSEIRFVDYELQKGGNGMLRFFQHKKPKTRRP